MRRFLVLLAVAALVMPSAAVAQTVTLKLATIVGNDNPFTTSAYKFKEVAEAKSGGRIKVEVYPAGQLAKNEIVQLEGMQLGTVDGLELPVTTAVSDKFHEIPKYYSRTLHSYPAAVWVMAKPKYDALPADLKKVVDDTMTAACAQHRQDEVRAETDGLAQMKAKGMQVNEVKDLRPFQERAH